MRKRIRRWRTDQCTDIGQTAWMLMFVRYYKPIIDTNGQSTFDMLLYLFPLNNVFFKKNPSQEKCKKAVLYFANIVGWKKRRSFWHASITSSPKWHQILGYHAPNAKILEVNTTLKTTLQSDLQLITNMTIKDKLVMNQLIRSPRNQEASFL